MWSKSNSDRYTDFDFVYADCDSHANEISELYSYSEEDDFTENKICFENFVKEFGLSTNRWSDMNANERNSILDRLANTLELRDRQERIKGVRTVLYLLQGVFNECTCIENQMLWTNELVIILYEREFFQMFVQLLLIEIDQLTSKDACPEPPKNLKDSQDIRLILNGLYTFVEVMYREDKKDSEKRLKIKKQFKEELSHPLTITGEFLANTLFGMITKFCAGKAPHFPIKKVLLLLWKVLLFTLGGSDVLRELKQKYRENAKLKPFKEDSLEVIRNMRPSPPPPSFEDQRVPILNPLRNPYVKNIKNRKSFKRQLSMFMFSKKTGEEAADEVNDDKNGDDNDGTVIDQNENSNMDENEEIDEGIETNENENKEMSNEGLESIIKEFVQGLIEDIRYIPNDISNDDGEKNEETSNNGNEVDTPRPGSPRHEFANENTQVNPNVSKDEIQSTQTVQFNKGLPWIPKVRVKDIDLFFQQVRLKNIGFSLPNNRTTTAGLPELTINSIRILNQYLYVSLSEEQIQREEDLARYPLTYKELDETSLDSPAEHLYKEMLPSLPHYMISLLKILFASIPTSKNKSEAFNVLSEAKPEVESLALIDVLKYAIEVDRHREIIIKAISGILLLILKHYKINHIYQFEYISQHLMMANCIPLILKFFNQDILRWVTSGQTISVIDFPACVIGEKAELTNEILDMGWADTPYSWRNMFSSINLLRVLNKLIKWKEVRIQALNYFKAYPILRKILGIQHPMIQLYVLKSIKMQVRHFGRQWRKANINIISIIYQKVRHRFTDDWVYSNQIGHKPVVTMNNFQQEERSLQEKIEAFHIRRYNKNWNGKTDCNENGKKNYLLLLGLSSEKNLDEVLMSTDDQEIKLTDEFKENYEIWLEREVFHNNINWDLILEKMDQGDDFD